MQTEGKVPDVNIKLMAICISDKIGILKDDFTLVNDILADENIVKKSL